VYLDEELKQVFRQQWKASLRKNKGDIHYVFLARNGKDMVKDFRRACNRACQDDGIRP
jgi:integrase